MGIKVYTIGVGRNGTSTHTSSRNYFRRHRLCADACLVIERATLQNIARSTGGKYFQSYRQHRPGNFAEIDQLEKTQMDVRHFFPHRGRLYVLVLLVLVLVLYSDLF